MILTFMPFVTYSHVLSYRGTHIIESRVTFFMFWQMMVKLILFLNCLLPPIVVYYNLMRVHPLLYWVFWGGEFMSNLMFSWLFLFYDDNYVYIIKGKMVTNDETFSVEGTSLSLTLMEEREMFFYPCPMDIRIIHYYSIIVYEKINSLKKIISWALCHDLIVSYSEIRIMPLKIHKNCKKKFSFVTFGPYVFGQVTRNTTFFYLP